MNNWRRVTKAFPCEICHKPDWCCVGEHYLLCMRVQSDKPCRSGGWFHDLNSKPDYVPPPRPQEQQIDPYKMMLDWSAANPEDWMREFALSIGVTFDSLCELGCAWARPHHAWAFPMYDGSSRMVGIRLRSESGKKWAVPGSRQGIFVPRCEAQRRAYLPEGPTDTAAARSIGLFALGRPSCQCGSVHLGEALRRLGVREIVIVADNDDPGFVGAKRLAFELNFKSCVYLPPTKDLREFVRCGGTREMIESTISGARWTQPNTI